MILKVDVECWKLIVLERIDTIPSLFISSGDFARWNEEFRWGLEVSWWVIPILWEKSKLNIYWSHLIQPRKYILFCLHFIPLFYRSRWLLWLSWKKSKILEEDCNHNHERKRGKYSSKQNCYLIPTTFVVCQNKHILDFFITFIRSAFDLPRVLPFCCGLPVF